MFVRSIKIKQRLFATFLLLGIIPVLILGLAASLESRKAVRGLVGTYSGQLAIQLGVTVQNEMEIIKNRVFEITLDPLVQEGLRNFEKSAKAEQFKMTDELKKAYQTAFVNEKKVKFFSVYSDKASIDYGKLETGINLGSGDIKAEVAARAKAAKGAPVWFVDKNGNLIMCYTVSGVKNNKPFATAMLALEASFLSDIVKKVNLGNGAQVELINKENILVASSPNDILKPGEAFPYPVLLEEINKNEAKKKMVRELQNLKLSETMYASYCPIEGTDWYLVSAVPLKKLDGSSAAIRVNIFVTGCMCTLVAFATAIFISRTITKPLGKIVKVMRRAENGELELAEQDTSKDELGELTQSYNNMITAIKRLIIQVHQSAATVADKTNTIASSAQQALVMSQSVSRALEEAASGACNQAEDTVACTDKMVQLSNAINGVTVDIQQTQEIIEKTVILSKHAAYILSDLNENARSADNSSVNIVNDIKGLNDDMKEILSIVKLIGSISEQTNMLALNASIEAARAGQAGLGFAVVAEEVKKLADQSKAASGSINGIIGRIIKRAGNAVDTANQTRDSMNRQMLAVDNTDAAFERINGAMLDLSGHMEDIKAEVARMLDIKESTVAAIENISSVSQQTAARSQEASSNTTEQILGAKALSELAFELSSISEGLEAAVSQFKF